jgi:pimeloyl-ACP methyl ester carboxylesterase
VNGTSSAALTDEQRAGAAANQKAMALYAGDEFLFAPKLRRRLHRVAAPVLVAWGTEDGVLMPDYGQAYANAFPHGQFQPIPEAGHFPHIEQPKAVLAAIGDFVDNVVKPDAG